MSISLEELYLVYSKHSTHASCLHHTELEVDSG